MQDDNDKSKDILNLDRVIFVGRTFQEYERMFNITSSDMGKKILDCPERASSFVAEAFNNHNCHVFGCDILYDNDTKTLEEKGRKDIDYTLEKLHQVSHLYNWDFHKSIEGLREFRTNSLRRFIFDYDNGKRQKRYLKAELPSLPFESNTFDMVLSSNFLFTIATDSVIRFILNRFWNFYVFRRKSEYFQSNNPTPSPQNILIDYLQTLRKDTKM